eukprot:gene26270-34895_t
MVNSVGSGPREIFYSQEYYILEALSLRATVEEENAVRIVETYVLPDDEKDNLPTDFYGEALDLALCLYIRPEKKFPNPQELITQILRDVVMEKLILRGNLYVLSPNNKASGKPLSSFVSALKNEATNKPLSSLMGSIKDLSTGGKGPAVVVDLSSFVPEEFIMSLICTERKGAPTSYTMLIGDQHIKLSAKLTLSPDIETFKRYEHTEHDNTFSLSTRDGKSLFLTSQSSEGFNKWHKVFRESMAVVIFNESFKLYPQSATLGLESETVNALSIQKIELAIRKCSRLVLNTNSHMIRAKKLLTMKEELQNIMEQLSTNSSYVSSVNIQTFVSDACTDELFLKDGQFLQLQKVFPGIAATISAHSAAYMSSCESNASSGRDKRRTSPFNTPQKKRNSKIIDKRSARKSGLHKLRASVGKSPPRGPVSGDEDDLMVTVDISDCDVQMKASPPKESTAIDCEPPSLTSQPVALSIINQVQAVGMSISNSASSTEITAAVGKSLSAAFTGLKRNFYSIAAASSTDNGDSSPPTTETNTKSRTNTMINQVQSREERKMEQPQESFENVNVNVGVCDVLDEMRFLHTSSDSMDSFASDYSKVSKRSRRSRKKGTPSSSKRLKGAVAVELDTTVERLPTLMETFSKSPSLQCVELISRDNIFSDSFMNSGSPFRDGLDMLSSSSWAVEEEHVSREETETADIRADFPSKVAEVTFSRRISKSEWIAMNEVVVANEPKYELAAVATDTFVVMKVSENTETSAQELDDGSGNPVVESSSPQQEDVFEVDVVGDAVSQPEPSVELVSASSDSCCFVEKNGLIEISVDIDRHETELVSSVSPTVDPIMLPPSTSSNQSPGKEIIDSETMNLPCHQGDIASGALPENAGGDATLYHPDESSPSINTQFSETAVDFPTHSTQLSAKSLSSTPSPISTKSYSDQAQCMASEEEENSGPVRSDCDDDTDEDGDDELSLRSAESSFDRQELTVKRHANDLDDIKDDLLVSFSTISPRMDTPQCAFSSSLFTISPDGENSSRVALNDQQSTFNADFSSLPIQSHNSLMASDFQYIDLKECVDSEVDSQSQRSASPISDNLVSSQTEEKVFPSASEKPSVQFCPDSPCADRPISLSTAHRSNDDFQYFGMMSIEEVAGIAKEVLNTTTDTVKTAVVSPNESCSNNELSSENQMHLSSKNSFRNDSLFHCVTFSPPATKNEKSKIFTPTMETEFAYWQKSNLEKSGLVEVMVDKNDCFDRSPIRKVSVSSPPTTENVAEKASVGNDSSHIKEVPNIEDNTKINKFISVSLSPAVMDVSMSRLGVSVEFSPVKNDVSFYYTVFDPNKFEKSIDEFSVNEMYENTLVEYQSSNDSETIFGFAEIYSASDMSPIIRKYPSSYLAESAVSMEKGKTVDNIGIFETDMLGPCCEEVTAPKALVNEVGVKPLSIAPLLERPHTPTPTAEDNRSRNSTEGSIDFINAQQLFHAHQEVENPSDSVEKISDPSPTIGDLKGSHTPLYIDSKTEGSVQIGTSLEVTGTALVDSSPESILGASYVPKFEISNIANPVSSIVDNIETTMPDMEEVESHMDQKVATIATSHVAATTDVSHSPIVSVGTVTAPMVVISEALEPSIGIMELAEKESVDTINAVFASSPSVPPTIVSSEGGTASVCHSPKVLVSKVSDPTATSLGILEASQAPHIVFSTFAEEIMRKEDLSVSCINLDESNCCETMEIDIHSNNIAGNDILLSFSDGNEKIYPTTDIVESCTTIAADSTNAVTSNSMVSSSTTEKISTLDSVSHKRSACSPIKLVKKPKGADKTHQAKSSNNYYTISTDVHTTSFNGSTGTTADTCKRVTDIIDLLSSVQAAAITATQSLEYAKPSSTLSTADLTSSTTTAETSPLEANTVGTNVSFQVHKIESRIFCDQLVEAESASALEPQFQTDGHTQGSLHSGRSSKGNSSSIKRILLPRGPTAKVKHIGDSSARNRLAFTLDAKKTMHEKKKQKNSGEQLLFATKATNTTPSSPSVSSLSTQRTKESSTEALPLNGMDREGTIYRQPSALKTTAAQEIVEIKAVGIQTDTVGVESVHTGSTSGRRSSGESSSVSNHRYSLSSVRKAPSDRYSESSLSLRKIAVYICIIIVAVSSIWLQLLPVNETIDQISVISPSSNVTSYITAPSNSSSSKQSQSTIIYQYVRVIAMRRPKVLKRSIVDYSAVCQSASETFNFSGESITETFSKIEKSGSLLQPKSFLSLKNKAHSNVDHNAVTEEAEVNTEHGNSSNSTATEGAEVNTEHGNFDNYTVAEEAKVNTEHGNSSNNIVTEGAEDNYTVAEDAEVNADNGNSDNFTVAEEAEVNTEYGNSSNNTVTEGAEDNLTVAEEAEVNADNGNSNEVSIVGDGGVLQSSREDIDNSTTLAVMDESSYPFQIVYSSATGEFVTLEVTTSTDNVSTAPSSQGDLFSDGDSNTEDEIVLGCDSLEVSEDNFSMSGPLNPETNEIGHETLIRLKECVEIFKSDLTGIKLFRCGDSANTDFNALVVSYSPQVILKLLQNLINDGKKYLKLGHVQFRRALKNVLVHLTGMPDDHAKILLD